LVRELERISVYEFNLGEGATKAKINSFRHFEFGKEEFYVLSRIRDSGLDYTNRTNYIAHHLIFDGLEIAVNPSPPEIFLQWTEWLDVWEGSSRWFEDEEIMDVSSCKMTGLSPAQSWQSATEDGGNAAYLVAEKAKRPVFLEVLPGQEENLLRMFAESCALMPLPMEAWQFPFTTYLQETDDAKDFMWIGGCGQPAAERIKHNGVPNHLNFTAFDQRSVKDPMDEKLVFIARNGRKAAIERKAPPPPPVADPVGAEGAGAGADGGSVAISAGRSGDAFSRTEREQFREAAASHAAAQATATAQTGGEGSKKRKKRPKWPWVAALAAVLLLAVFIVLKTDVLDIIKEGVGGGDSVAQAGGSSSNGDGGKTPDVLPAEPEPEVEATNSPEGITAGVPALAKVVDKDDRFNTWIEFQVGAAKPARIDVTAMDQNDYDRFGDKLRELEVGDTMTMTFREGSEPGMFAIANLAPPTAAVAVQPLVDPTVAQPIRLPETPVDVQAEFLENEVGLKEIDLSVTLLSPTGVELPPYRFPPEQKARFFELQQYLKAGRKVKFTYRNVGGRISDFDFSVEATAASSAQPVQVISTTSPPPFPVTESFILWLTRNEVENPQLESMSANGDAAFVQTLKTALSSIAKRKAFAWETDYDGTQALVNTSPMDGSKRYVVIYDARVKELLGMDRYTLETPQEEGASLFLRFLFKSPSEVDLIFENQGARNAAKRGIVLRFPNLETNRATDLYLLSPRVVAAKPNELPKDYLSMDRNRVTLAKNGAFGHGLRAIGSAGPLQLKLSMNQSQHVYYGSMLRPNHFTSQFLTSFPQLLVKPIPEDPLTCELALFIDYMTDLQQDFQREIAKLNQQANDEFSTQMPMQKIYDALERFGGRTGFPLDNYKPGSGKGTYGPFIINAVVEFFQQVHGYNPALAVRFGKDLALDPQRFVNDDLQYREFWKKVCDRAKKEAFAPFGLGFDSRTLVQDVDRVIGTLRFLREAERAFGVKDQSINKMIFATVKVIIQGDPSQNPPLDGARKKLYDKLILYKGTREALAATTKHNDEWAKYFKDFPGGFAPTELTSTEFRKAINCIEDEEMVKKYQSRLFDVGSTKQQLGPLKQWQTFLEKEIAKKAPYVVPQEYEPARKERVMKSYFHGGEWSLSLFREGLTDPEAELVRFK